jgi:dTDP-4-dehydrorhamnose 3,5-epimerase
MNVIQTNLPGVLLIEPEVFGDYRGFFKENYQAERYADIGIDQVFVQDNHSRSQQGVLRGLHLQKTRPQGKLVSCSLGVVYDVAVDVNPISETFGQYVGVELTGDNHRQLWIPPGYAHGFCVLSDVADFQYKCTELYFPEDEGGLIWNDPEVAIDWPIEKPILSNKDLKLSTLAQIRAKSRI